MDDKLKPKLFSVMKSYTKEQFVKDIVAGIIGGDYRPAFIHRLSPCQRRNTGEGYLYGDHGRFCDLLFGWKQSTDRRTYGRPLLP